MRKSLITGAQLADAYATMLQEELKGKVPDVVAESAAKDWYGRLRQENLGAMLTDKQFSALKKSVKPKIRALARSIIKYWDIELDEETREAMLADARQKEESK